MHIATPNCPCPSAANMWGALELCEHVRVETSGTSMTYSTFVRALSRNVTGRGFLAFLRRPVKQGLRLKVKYRGCA